MKSRSFDIVLGFNNKNVEISTKNGSDFKKNNIWLMLFLGAIIGFINGFFGGGGGMICVPLLAGVLKLPEKIAHATTILIILPMSIFSLIVYFFNSSFEFLSAIPILIGFVLGGGIGAIALKKISNDSLKLVFDIIILIAGIVSVIRF